MAVKIELKRSAVPGKVPTTSSLDLGELALNTYDGRAFMKQQQGTTQSIIELATTAGSGSTVASASYAVSASYSATSSFALNFNPAASASYALQALSSSYATSGSFSQTSSLAFQAITASYAASSSYATSSTTASYALTASYVSGSGNLITASYALTASFVKNAQTASYVVNALTASNIQGGTNNFIPIWSGSTVLSSSLIYQTGSTVVLNQLNPTAGAEEALYVWQPSQTSYNVVGGKGNLNNYLQLNIQNLNAGNTVSSDVVATANNGDENGNYVDLGING